MIRLSRWQTALSASSVKVTVVKANRHFVYHARHGRELQPNMTEITKITHRLSRATYSLLHHVTSWMMYSNRMRWLTSLIKSQILERCAGANSRHNANMDTDGRWEFIIEHMFMTTERVIYGVRRPNHALSIPTNSLLSSSQEQTP